MNTKTAVGDSCAMLMVFMLCICACSGAGVGRSDTASGSDENAVELEQLRVTAFRYRWLHAKTEHCEILSEVTNRALVGRTVQIFEQLSGVFAANSALYKWSGDLPIKFIFIYEKSSERFLKSVGKTKIVGTRSTPRFSPSLRDDWDVPEEPRPFMYSFSKNDKEQIVFVIPISDYDLSSAITTENIARDYAEKIFRGRLIINQFQFKANPLKNSTLSSFLHAANPLRIESLIGPLVQGYRLPKVEDKDNRTSGCFAVTDKTIEIRRYDLTREYLAIFDTTDYFFSSECPPGHPFRTGFVDWRNQKIEEIRKKYLLEPFVGLRAILEEPLPDFKPGKRDAKTSERNITYVREIMDFVCYCMFGPDPKTRTAYVRLVRSFAKRPVTEEIFKEYFGMGYERFQDEIYAYFRNLDRNNPRYKDSKWGPEGIVVARFEKKDLPKLATFRDASRNQTARIIADWFTLNKKQDMARKLLLNAAEDVPSISNDPEFAATLGLAHAVVGDRASALVMLEKAAAAKIVRPRVYRTLSSIYLDNILNEKGEAYKLNTSEFRKVAEPLFIALQQPEPSPDTYMQIIKLLTHVASAPPREFLEKIARDCGTLFPDDFKLLDRLVPLLTNEKCPSLAAALLAKTAGCPLTDNEQGHLERLRAQCATAAP